MLIQGFNKRIACIAGAGNYLLSSFNLKKECLQHRLTVEHFGCTLFCSYKSVHQSEHFLDKHPHLPKRKGRHWGKKSAQTCTKALKAGNAALFYQKLYPWPCKPQ